MAHKVHWLLLTRHGRSLVACGRDEPRYRTASISHVTCKHCLAYHHLTERNT